MRIDLHIAVVPRDGSATPKANCKLQKHSRHHHYKRQVLHRQVSKLRSGKCSTDSTPDVMVQLRPTKPNVLVNAPPFLSPEPEDRLIVAHTLPHELRYDVPPQDAESGRSGTHAAPTMKAKEPRETGSAARVRRAVSDESNTDENPILQDSQQGVQPAEQAPLKPLASWARLVPLARWWYSGGTDREIS